MPEVSLAGLWRGDVVGEDDIYANAGWLPSLAADDNHEVIFKSGLGDISLAGEAGIQTVAVDIATASGSKVIAPSFGQAVDVSRGWRQHNKTAPEQIYEPAPWTPTSVGIAPRKNRGDDGIISVPVVPATGTLAPRHRLARYTSAVVRVGDKTFRGEGLSSTFYFSEFAPTGIGWFFYMSGTTSTTYSFGIVGQTLYPSLHPWDILGGRITGCVINIREYRIGGVSVGGNDNKAINLSSVTPQIYTTADPNEITLEQIPLHNDPIIVNGIRVVKRWVMIVWDNLTVRTGLVTRQNPPSSVRINSLTFDKIGAAGTTRI